MSGHAPLHCPLHCLPITLRTSHASRSPSQSRPGRAQLELYKPTNGVSVFVGVPLPSPAWKIGAPISGKRPITFLCLGIVCPRKNQARSEQGERTHVACAAAHPTGARSDWRASL